MPSILEHTPVTQLKGVGPRLAERLARLELRTVADLLFHLPSRYEDRTHSLPIGSLQPGQHALIEGEVGYSEVAHSRKRRSAMLLVHLSDGSGELLLRFFHFNASLQQQFTQGARLRCFGEVRAGPHSIELVHPETQRLDEGEATGSAGLVAVYPTTEGLHQQSLRQLMDQALVGLRNGGLVDWLPTDLLVDLPLGIDLPLPDLVTALGMVHQPPAESELRLLASREHVSYRRLAAEELLAHQLSLRRLRAQLRERRATPLHPSGSLLNRFIEALPFQLTAAQQRVIDQISADLRADQPMLRLVQGDVGSGKTVVAAAACIQAIAAGHQAALMAPTELLAEQHFRTLDEWLRPLEIQLGWLTGRVKGNERAMQLAALESGEIQLAIGTHALFQEGVTFRSLALTVTDEQHRFGVHQRLALREKGGRPHQLIMTATPIPRTLAMTAYGDLDTSVIDQLPPGRTPVKTVAISDQRRDEVIHRIRFALEEGRQAYWVCTLIEESELLQAQAAEQSSEELASQLAPLRVGLVHGRMGAAEKERVMAEFKAGQLQLLVATTVIEVGVDVPNASLMIIENAERLGLAQLHQLRGRVGRGVVESSCVLLYHGPLSDQAHARLQVLRESNDGFHIAEQDLAIRGPGEVLGTRQTGLVRFRVADLARDEALIPALQSLADRLLRDHPDRVSPLIRRWLGEGERFGAV